MAKTMQLRGYTPLILSYSGCRFAHQYFDLFGIDQLIMWDQFQQEEGLPENALARIAASCCPTILPYNKP